MNKCKKKHFHDAKWNIKRAIKAVHKHRTTAAHGFIIKAIRHLTKVELDLWPETEEDQKEFK